jgi:hypothetical protein
MGAHTPFYCEMLEQQLTWRKRQQALSQEFGPWVGKLYPHIFPRGLEHQNLWPGLWPDGQFPLQPYLVEGDIQAHKGMGNLLSSWALCASLYFPFGRSEEGRRILAGFLREHMRLPVATVDRVELEWQHGENPRFRPPVLLGERDGSRGSNQTSPDVAFEGITDDGGAFLVLTEVKFMERHFYPCSVFRKPELREAAMQSGLGACRRTPVRFAPGPICAQASLLGRRYWEHIEDVFDRDARLSCCPAAMDGYQILRQQALAEALAKHGAFDLVVSSVACHAGNTDLLGCLRTAGIRDIRIDWAPLFRGKARFLVFTHQEWVRHVREQTELPDWCGNWLEYVKARYAM